MPLSNDLAHILKHTRPLWEVLKEKHIFITGGTGFFGVWLLESFLYANQQLNLNATATVLTRNPHKFAAKCPELFANPALTFIAGDVRTFDFPTTPVSHVIHAATDASAQLLKENPIQMFNTIVTGTKHVLELAKRNNATLLFTSSGAVYGEQPSSLTHVDENYRGQFDPMDPKAAYGIGKLSAEHLCALYAHQYKLPVKIARCFAFIGPYLPMNVHFAVGNFILDGLKGGPIVVNGDGSPYRSYLYAADLMIWLWTILIKGENLTPYNVGSDQALNIAEIANQVAKQFSPAPDVKIMQKVRADLQPSRYVPCTKLAQETLNLRQYIDFDMALKATIAWRQPENVEA